MKTDKFRIAEGSKVDLKDHSTGYSGDYTDKDEAVTDLAKNIEQLTKLQDVLYAQNVHALLLVFQAMDAAGKDSVIKHVMSGVNPQGCQVTSFKAPSAEELDHDFLWRCQLALPERGRIGIFNRSHYEEVLVVRVHPGILQGQQLPDEIKNDKDIWKKRFRHIRDWEDTLADNGTHVLKFFLNVSKDEQKKRFLERIDQPDKNWKFSAGDTKERALWKEYMSSLRGCHVSDIDGTFALVHNPCRQKMVHPSSRFRDHSPETRIAKNEISRTYRGAQGRVARV